MNMVASLRAWHTRRANKEKNPTARFVFEVAREAGNIVAMKGVLYESHPPPNYTYKEFDRAADILRASVWPGAQKAKHLFALLNDEYFFDYRREHRLSDADAWADEILALDPSLKPAIASRRVRTISGPYRITLVRQMLGEKEVSPADILPALTEFVWEQDSWSITLCQELVEYALEKDDFPTAYETALRLGNHTLLSDNTWKRLVARGLEAVEADTLSFRQLRKLSRLACG